LHTNLTTITPDINTVVERLGSSSKSSLQSHQSHNHHYHHSKHKQEQQIDLKSVSTATTATSSSSSDILTRSHIVHQNECCSPQAQKVTFVEQQQQQSATNSTTSAADKKLVDKAIIFDHIIKVHI